MINHLRTLLLNKNGSASPTIDYPGEEYVPPSYAAKTLSNGLLTVHQILFGIKPDRAMLNYRLHELTTLLHTSELADFVTDLDPRVTYWPIRDNGLFDLLVASPITDTLVGTQGLYLFGYPDLVTGAGRIFYSFVMEVIDGSTVTVTDEHVAASVVANPYVITDGLSDQIPIQGTTVTFSFQAGVGAKWRVSWLARPSNTLSEVYSDLQSGLTSDLVEELFGSNPVEPFTTWRNLWLDSIFMPQQLGAVTLALGYKINELTV